ncbi:MAG: hypothetical protein F6K42_15245 [Leptolyngbya sp. SIO1D8]|nr:hypothetical protein [Leptolyngbya sp. SIO1D8]
MSHAKFRSGYLKPGCVVGWHRDIETLPCQRVNQRFQVPYSVRFTHTAADRLSIKKTKPD